MIKKKIKKKSILGAEDEGFLTRMSVKLLSVGGDVSIGVDCDSQYLKP